MQHSTLPQYSSSHRPAICRPSGISGKLRASRHPIAAICAKTKASAGTAGCCASHALRHGHVESRDVQLPGPHGSMLQQHTQQHHQHLFGAYNKQRRSTVVAAAGSQGGFPQQPRPPSIVPPTQINPSNLQNQDPNNIDPNGLAGLFMAYAMQLQQAMAQEQQQTAAGSQGANVLVKSLGFHPPGAEQPLLDDVSFHLKPNQLGLIIGRSGSGKTTLLQLLAGLSEQTSGQIFIHRPTADSHASGLLVPTHIEERMQQVCRASPYCG